MRAQFMGTPEAAVVILDALVTVADVTGVVTRPDRPQGRSKRLIPPPVKERAVELGLDVAQPTSAPDLAAAVDGAGADVVVVAAYGRLVRPEVLAMPAHSKTTSAPALPTMPLMAPAMSGVSLGSRV